MADKPEDQHEVEAARPSKPRRVVKLEDLKAEAEARAGMSLERYEEIARARAAGEDIDTTPEEDDEYERASEQFKDLAQRFQKAFAPKLPKLRQMIFTAQSNPWLNDKADDDGPSLPESLAPQILSAVQRNRDQQARVAQQQRELHDGIAEAVAAKEEKEENQRRVARDQLAAMQAMVSQMEDQGAATAAVADQQSRMSRWNLIVAGLTLLATLAGLVVALIALAATK
jgi:hypothetical protein